MEDEAEVGADEDVEASVLLVLERDEDVGREEEAVNV